MNTATIRWSDILRSIFVPRPWPMSLNRFPSATRPCPSRIRSARDSSGDPGSRPSPSVPCRPHGECGTWDCHVARDLRRNTMSPSGEQVFTSGDDLAGRHSSSTRLHACLRQQRRIDASGDRHSLVALDETGLRQSQKSNFRRPWRGQCNFLALQDEWYRRHSRRRSPGRESFLFWFRSGEWRNVLMKGTALIVSFAVVCLPWWIWNITQHQSLLDGRFMPIGGVNFWNRPSFPRDFSTGTI